MGDVAICADRREEGLQAVALHPRTREQGYTGHADWARIAAVKRRSKSRPSATRYPYPRTAGAWFKKPV